MLINLSGQTLTPTFVKTRNKKTFLRLKLLYLAPRVESESTTLLTPCKKKVDFFIARSSLEKLEFLGLIRLSIVSSCYPGRRTKKKNAENLLNSSHFGRHKRKIYLPNRAFCHSILLRLHRIASEETSNSLHVEAMALGVW